MKYCKKIIPLVLAVCIVFTSCGNENALKLEYTYVDESIFTNTDNAHVEAKADLFATDICVIPVTRNDSNDKITSDAALVIDITNNEPVFCKNIYEKLYPASITKILTAYITLKHTKLDDIVTVSHDAANITESGTKKCGYNEGDKISVRDLLYSMLIYSGNDAATALGCHISGNENEFAKLMNEEAKKMGATNSHFTNANGLHNDEHYTTAYDLYLIFNECLKNEEFKKIIKLDKYTVNYTDSEGKELSKTFTTTNQYINGTTKAPSGISVTGGKTGTTKKAGSCLIIHTTDTNNKEYISLILHSESSYTLYDQMNILLNMQH